MRAQTRYAKADGISIAYQVTGDGPIDLVRVPGWISNVDYDWEYPPNARLIERLSQFSRFIRFDKRGTGLSDRDVGFPTLEQRMEDVHAVMDAVGSQRAVLFGTSEGGNMSILYAATYPERVSALILHGSQARGEWAPDYPWAPKREETIKQLEALERDWGGRNRPQRRCAEPCRRSIGARVVRRLHARIGQPTSRAKDVEVGL